MIHLDTNIIIEYFRGDKVVANRLERAVPDLALSSLVAAELIYGACRSDRSEKHLEQVHQFLALVQVIPFDLACANNFGELKARLTREGRIPGEIDMMIAATCISHAATLITRNTKHFEAIPGLTVDNWKA